MPNVELNTDPSYLERRFENLENATGQTAPSFSSGTSTPAALLAILTNKTIGNAGSTVITPAANTNIFTGVNLKISGGTYANPETVAVSARASTTFTAPFVDAHAGTSTAQYLVNATSATAVTGDTTAAITLDNVTNVVAGQSLYIKGTGADSAKTNGPLVIQSVNSGSKLVTFTAPIPTNSYSATILVGSVAPTVDTTTTVVPSLTTQLTAGSVSALSVGMTVGIHGTAANIAILESATIAAINGSVVTFTSALQGAYTVAEIGIVPATLTTFTTAVGSRQKTIAHGLAYTPSVYSIVPTSAGQIFQYASPDATNIYLQADIVGRTCNIGLGR